MKCKIIPPWLLVLVIDQPQIDQRKEFPVKKTAGDTVCVHKLARAAEKKSLKSPRVISLN